MYDLGPLRQHLLGEGTANERPSQLELASDAARAVSSGVCAVLQAPTGVGKTRALLYAGIVHVLNQPDSNKSLYVAKTLPQLKHVSEEIDRYVIPAIDSVELSQVIRLGIGLGIKPMIDRVCSEHLGDMIECTSCPLGHQRHRPAIKTGTASLRHYGIAVKAGRCPYAYMRDSLKQSNLIIGTHAYVNHDFWLSRTFGSLDRLESVVVLVDEAHNYIDDLTQKSIVEVRLDANAHAGRYRQAESEIDMPDLYSNFIDKICAILAWIEYRHRVEAELNATSVDFGEMIYQLGTELRAALLLRVGYKAIQDKVLDIEKSWKDGQEIKRRDRKTLVRLLEAETGDFDGLIDRYEELIHRIDALYDEVSEISDRITDCYEEKDEAFRSWSEVKTEFDEARSNGALTRDLVERQNVAYEHRVNVATEQKEIINSLKKDRTQRFSDIDALKGQKQQVYEAIREAQGFVFDAVSYGYQMTQKLGELRSIIFSFVEDLKLRIGGTPTLAEDTHQPSGLLELARTVAESLQRINEVLSILPNESGVAGAFVDANPEEFESGIQALSAIEGQVAEDYVDWLSDTKQLLSVFRDMAMTPHRYYVENYESNAHGDSHPKSVLITDLDIEGKVHRFLNRFHSVVMCSATLSPADLTAEMLGWPDAIAREYPPVFPRENYCVHGLLGFNTGMAYASAEGGGRVSGEQLDYLKRIVPEVVNSLKGNVGCFVCSESFVRDAYPVLFREGLWDDDVKHLLLSNANRSLEDDYEVLSKSLGLPNEKSLDFDGEWKSILRRNEQYRIVVWFATSGKFSEGVDFPGDELSSALLIGIPYPNTIEVQALLRARVRYYSDHKSEDLANLVEEVSFHVHPYRKLCQAAGRIHRRSDDRGNIVILDDRVFGQQSSVYPDGTLRVKPNRRMNDSSVRYNILPLRVREQMVIVDTTHCRAGFQKRHLSTSFPGVVMGSYQDLYIDIKEFYEGFDYKDGARTRIRDYHLSNILYSVSRKALLHALQKQLTIVSLYVPRGYGDRVNRGYAFVTVSSYDSDAVILQALAKIRFGRRFLKAARIVES